MNFGLRTMRRSDLCTFGFGISVLALLFLGVLVLGTFGLCAFAFGTVGLGLLVLVLLIFGFLF